MVSSHRHCSIALYLFGILIGSSGEPELEGASRNGNPLRVHFDY